MGLNDLSGAASHDRNFSLLFQALRIMCDDYAKCHDSLEKLASVSSQKINQLNLLYTKIYLVTL